MPRALVVAVIIAISLCRVARAQSDERTVMHVFQEDSRIVYVTIVDRPPAPVGLVTSEDKSRQERWFTVSPSQFDKMWSTLVAAGIENHARSDGDKTPERSYDAVNYYVFSTAEMPHGSKKNYAVPVGKAPASIVALANQLRDYAK
jgi:hypothetical protein